MKRMTVWITVLAAVCLLAPGASAGPVDNLSFMTEQYPPYNMKVGGDVKGIAVELIGAVFKKMGSSKTAKDVRLMPWANAYNQVQKKADTCLFSMTRTEAREPLFKWAGPISPTTIALLGRKDKNIKINSLDDVKKYKIGVIKSDVGEQLLLEAGVAKSQLDSTSKLVNNIRKLDKGRIDLISYEENVAKWEIKQNGFNASDFETVYILKKAELHYAFHKSTPDSVVAAFQKALDALKQDGTYDSIVGTYLK